MFSFSIPVWLMIGNIVASIILGILLYNRVYDKYALDRNTPRSAVYTYLSISCIISYVFSAAVCYIYVNKTPLRDFWFFYGVWVVFLLMGLYVLSTGSKKKSRKRRSRSGLHTGPVDVDWD